MCSSTMLLTRRKRHSSGLAQGKKIVIEDDIVTEITADEVSEENFDEVFDGTGMVAMPGMTDAHVHMGCLFAKGEFPVDYATVLTVAKCKDALMAGFTTFRDAGSVSEGLKLAFDEGVLPGPRIYPCGAYISQTLPRLLLIGSIPDQLAWPGKKQLTLAHFPGASAHLEYALAGKYQMDQVMVADTRPPCLARSTAFDAAIEDGKLNIIGIILFEGLLIYICHSRVSSALSRCGQLCARSLV